MDTATTLRKILKPGDTVWCVLRHVASSGMSRRIDFYKMIGNEPRYLSGHIADLLGLKLHNTRDGITLRGCGMDMGFHVVYETGQALWPDGTKTPHGSRNGEPDSVGGYALKHRWL